MEELSPQQKRLETINKRYGSVSNMLKKRDVRDLILGGYNGGIKKTPKGFSKWDEEELKEFTAKRERDSKGRFLPKTETSGPVRPEDTA